MKKLLLLASIILLSIRAYGQECDAVTDMSACMDGEMDRATKAIGLNYKLPNGYIMTGAFDLNYPPANPIELKRTAFGLKAAKWSHEDKECILFIECAGMKTRIDKSIDKVPEHVFFWIRRTLNMDYSDIKTTDEQMEKLKKIVTFWSSLKSKKIFNAQHVIVCPVKDKKAVYQGKYRHRLDYIIVKWGEGFTVSFLLTRKGYRNIDKYITDVEGAFWFDD